MFITPQVRAVLPRRADLPGERGVLITSYAAHRRKAYFFFLLQSEYGDIYKVTLGTEGHQVRRKSIRLYLVVSCCLGY